MKTLSFKKLTCSLLVAGMILTSALAPRNAKAMSGWGAAPVIALIAVSLGALTSYNAYTYPGRAEAGTNQRNGRTNLVLGLLIAGIALDGSNGQDIQFAKIEDEQKARTLGFSKNELDSYNSEIDQINLVREEVMSAVASTQVKSDREKVVIAKALWNEKSKELSAEAFSGVQKVSTAFANSLQ